MRRTFKFALLFIVLITAIAACSTPGSSNTALINGTPTPTFLPASMMTADASRLNVDLTKQAADAQLSLLHLQGTQVQLQMTQAVATEQYFQRQTEAAIQIAQTNAAGTAVQASINSTGTAAVLSADATATANKQAWESSVQMTTTAQYEAAVAFAATAQAIERETRSEEITLEFSMWAPRVGLSILFVLGLAASIAGGKALYDARWIIAAHLGVVRWGKDGKPYFIAPSFDEEGVIEGITFVDPAKMLSSGMSLLPGRNKEVDQGVSEQTRLLITSGAQQIEHKLAGMLGGGEESSPRTSSEKFVAPAQLTAPAPEPQLPSSVQIVVMSPDDSRIADWVSDVTSQIIEGETRE
jgi:hypothetical protein